MSELTRNSPYAVGEYISSRYKILKILGGGMGLVYIVEDTNYGYQLALKTLREERTRDFVDGQNDRKASREEFYNWVTMGNHPHIVSAYAVDELDGRLYIILEYVAPDVDGRNTLASHIHGRPLSFDQIVTWSIECCLGMEHAMSRGMRCHRDIKPANIMISREGCAKITDFGLAKFYQEFCSGGTLGYIAPEVYEHPSRVDIRSDIYSFGIVLWQMASGNPFPPFWGKSPDFNRLAKDIYQAQTTRLPTRIDTPLWPVIERCLKVSPNERYKDFKELRFDFKKFSINGANKISSKSEYAIHDEFNSLITRGFSLHCLGKESEAEGFLRKALTINPRSWHAYNNLGFVLRARNKPQEAIRCFEKATQIAPNDWIPAHGLGTTFLMQGRLREALMCLDRAVNNCSDNPGILSDRALVLSELGSYDNAERDYMRAIRLAPHDAKIIVVRALNLMRMRNWQKAIDCMDCHILDIQSNPHCWALSVEIRCECKKALRRC